MANCTRCGRQLPPLSWKKICQWCVQHEAAQRGELGDDVQQRVIPAPWVRRSTESSITLTHIFFGANIAVFLAMALANGSILDFSGQVSVHFGANFGPYTLSGEWWRLVTYMFLHGGLLHIAFNMWCLWDLGALAESLYGRWTFAGIYLLTGIAGGLASVAWNPSVLSVGASGAIFGLAGALIASFYLGEFSLPRVAIQGTLRSLLVFAVFNLGFGGLVGGIDNACHIGGLVSGLVLGAMVARLAPQHDAPMRRVAVIGVVALAIFASGLGVRQWRGRPMRMAREFEALSRGDSDPVPRLQAILKQNPNLAEAHFELGQIYFNQQNLPLAEAELKRTVELQPQNSEARFDLGLAYLNDKKMDDAKTVFTQMLAQDASSGGAHYGLGLVSAEQGDYKGALDEFKKASSSGSQISGLNYDMGNAYFKLKMYDDAIAAYVKEKEKSGDDPDIENALANAYQAKGMTAEAQAAKAQAAKMQPNNAGR
jgi:rhomboid protease GluP